MTTNNPDGFQRGLKIKGQKLEAVENFRHLGSIISNKESKLEIHSKIAPIKAAFSQLKVMWKDKNILLASKNKLMWVLVSSIPLCLWELELPIASRLKTLDSSFKLL